MPNVNNSIDDKNICLVVKRLIKYADIGIITAIAKLKALVNHWAVSAVKDNSCIICGKAVVKEV